MRGQIVRVHYDIFFVSDGENVVPCRAKGTLKLKKDSLFVGDIVDFEDGVINGIEKRKNLFIRPAVSNVDQIFIFLAPVPEPDFMLLDTLLVNAFKENVKVCIIVNKSDLKADELFEKIKREYKDCKVGIYQVSALEKTGIEELKKKLKNKLTVLAGQSAVGKTSFINALFGYSLKTGDLSEKISRGKHSTTYSNVYFSGDIRVIDTPGFAVIETGKMEKDEKIKDYYPEYVKVAHLCKFRDCNHINEPGCKVIELVKEGSFSKERYDRYVELHFSDIKRREY